MGVHESDYSKWMKKNKRSKRKIANEVALLKDLPKISIIMPVYNVDLQWLTKGINSVRNQLYKNWELCIVDDGSSDRNTVNFLKSIHDPNIKLKFLEKNQGSSA
jgi:glycosyltransferase involved in cell wall biosynthesis